MKEQAVTGQAEDNVNLSPLHTSNPQNHLKTLTTNKNFFVTYWGADKSLARPGRKQATATEDFEFHMSYPQS